MSNNKVKTYESRHIFVCRPIFNSTISSMWYTHTGTKLPETLQHLSEPWNPPLLRGLRSLSWINSSPPCSPPAMGYGAILLPTNKRSIDQAATETVSLWLLTLPCLSAPLSIRLFACQKQLPPHHLELAPLLNPWRSQPIASRFFFYTFLHCFKGWHMQSCTLRRAVTLHLLALL